MLKILSIVSMVLTSAIFTTVNANEIEVTVVKFTEREQGIDPYPIRYIIDKEFLRVDDDDDKGNYVLYDDKKRIIYSINHDDSTILVINNTDWKLPDFKFSRNVSWKVMDGAPKINNKPVYTYWLSAGETVCSEAQVAEGFLMQEAQLLMRYRQTLSSGQVEAIVATPEEMRTPCLMVDKVYNTGSVYEKGFPVQQWHLNGLQRLMTGYKTAEKVSTKLFELPEKYKKYEMGDNLSFGER